MNISKVINNNVVSAYDEKNREVVVMGKGIGFKAHSGNLIDETKIEKIFRIENQILIKQFQELLENMPLTHMQLSTEIIAYAEKSLELKLNQSIYITLTDHISFAIQRYEQGIQLANALLWEIRKVYKKEFELGKYAVALINERLKLHFTDDEAGFIALHFVNAEYSTGFGKTVETTEMIQGILKIVQEEFGMEFDEDSLHYERFVTHLKFLAQRVCCHELLRDEEVEFARLMQGRYPEECSCSRKIADYIKENYHEQLSGEEVMFLAIHIKRIRMTEI